MKKLQLLLVFIFSFSVCAQNNSTTVNTRIGVVAAEKSNIVYRGINNPIYIAVSNAKSFNASAPGLKKISEGKYTLTPGQGLESVIKLEIILHDNTKIYEEHVFRIKNISRISGTINNNINCSKCIVKITKSELENAIIGATAENFIFKVESFIVKINKKKFIRSDGNVFTNEIWNEIKKLKKGSRFFITNIRYSANFDVCLPAVDPIEVIIVDEEIPYYQSKEFVKDSLVVLKKEKKKLKK